VALSTASVVVGSTLSQWDIGHSPGSSFGYRVTAFRADSHFGTSAAITGVAGPIPAPQYFKVLQSKSTSAALTVYWDPVDYEDATGIHPIQTYQVVGGPVNGAGATKTVTGAAQTIVPLSAGAGDYQWKVSALFPDGSGGWLASAPTVLDYSSSRFRILTMGFWAEETTHDNALIGDGLGDEVYVAAVVNVTDRALAKKSVTALRTPTIGEGRNLTTYFTGRIQGGTAGPNGGIQAKDYVPSGLDLMASPKPPGSVSGLPWVIWEGALDDSAMVIIHPTLWEYDGDGRLYDDWVHHVTNAAADGYTDEGVMRQSIMRVRDAESLMSVTGTRVYDCYRGIVIGTPRQCSAPMDRPIGYQWRGDDWNRLFDEALVFTKAAIMKALSSPGDRNLPGSTLIFPRIDTTNPQEARYELYLRVERLP